MDQASMRLHEKNIVQTGTADSTPTIRNIIEFDQIGHSSIINNHQEGIVFYKSNRFQDVLNLPHVCPEDISSLIKNQKVNRPLVSSLIKFHLRSYAIRNIKQVCSYFKLPNRTYYQAIAIMDCVISKHKYNLDEYKMIALTAFRLSSKLENSFSDVPEAELFRLFLPVDCTKEDFYACEFKIFKVLNFSPRIQTSFNLIEFFLEKGIINNMDFSNEIDAEDIKTYNRCLDDIISCLIKITVYEFGFYRFTPFGLAVSIIACARGLVNLQPWTSEMEIITEVTFKDIEHCFVTIQKAIDNSEDRNAFSDIVRKHFEFSKITSLRKCSLVTSDHQQENLPVNLIDILNDIENCHLVKAEGNQGTAVEKAEFIFKPFHECRQECRSMNANKLIRTRNPFQDVIENKIFMGNNRDIEEDRETRILIPRRFKKISHKKTNNHRK